MEVRYSLLHYVLLILAVANVGTRDLPDIYALRPAVLELWAYISG